VKIVIIGGGSFSTPSLFQYLASERASGLEVVLAGRSRENLQAVQRACQLLNHGGLKINVELTETSHWRKILDGADCVIFQIRVGGLEGRLFDETFPHKYGMCGDEGLGLGGLSAAWRTWPVLSPMLEAIAGFCPGAFVILLTSPLSLLVRASLKHTSLMLVGICELPWTTLEHIGTSLGLATSEFTADYLGVNHLGWFFHIRTGSRDLLDDLLVRDQRFPTREFLRKQLCFPTRYLRLHYEPDKVLAEQRSQKTPRAEVLGDIQTRSYRSYESGQPEKIVAALSARATPWYSHAVGPLLLALSGQQVDTPFFLSKRGGSYVPFLAPDDIVECRHQWVEGALRAIPLSGAPPKHVVKTLLQFVQFEKTAAEAIASRSRRLLMEALSLHPWTRDHKQLHSMVDEIVNTNDAMLATNG